MTPVVVGKLLIAVIWAIVAVLMTWDVMTNDVSDLNLRVAYIISAALLSLAHVELVYLYQDQNNKNDR